MVNWKSGKKIGYLPEAHKDSIEGLTFLDKLETFASCSMDGKVKIWDSNKMHLRGAYELKAGVTKILFNKKMNLLFASTVNGQI